VCANYAEQQTNRVPKMRTASGPDKATGRTESIWVQEHQLFPLLTTSPATFCPGRLVTRSRGCFEGDCPKAVTAMAATHAPELPHAFVEDGDA
jgi:hypothetical protein